MEIEELLATAARTAAIYILMLVVLRSLGKRAVGNFSAFDLLVALMLGEVVDEIIYGDVTFAQGAVAIGVIALMEYGNEWLSYFDHGFDRVLSGTPTVLIKDGQPQPEGLRKERINQNELMSHLRLYGIEALSEVKLAMMENDGQVSVIEQEWARPLQKGDLSRKQSKESTGVEIKPAFAEETRKSA
jgi:uncharacterized membrane protein YcaP (DUF421 family)